MVHLKGFTLDFPEIGHGVGVGVGSDEDFDAVGELFGQPKCDIGLIEMFLVDEMVDSFKDYDDLVVNYGGIVNYLVFELLVADVEPVGEVFSQFFLQQLDFLANVQIFLIIAKVLSVSSESGKLQKSSCCCCRRSWRSGG